MNKLKKMKENIKGFTLVEIIVVLLILAILAAIAIPSMLGYVNQAKESQYISEARTGYVSAQTIATQAAGTATKAGEMTTDEIAAVVTTISDATKINKYIGADSPVASVTVKAADITASGKIKECTVTLKTGQDVKIVLGKDAVIVK